MKLAVVLVHYHAGELTRRALQHVAVDAERSNLELETVVIDHGGTANDHAVLAALRGVRVVDPSANRGYSGGVNRGVAETVADSILFLNPDVRLQSGALLPLLAALQRATASPAHVSTGTPNAASSFRQPRNAGDGPRSSRR